MDKTFFIVIQTTKKKGYDEIDNNITQVTMRNTFFLLLGLRATILVVTLFLASKHSLLTQTVFSKRKFI